MFTRDDARWLSDTVLALYSAQDVAQLSTTSIAAMRHRFRLVASSCEEISYDTTRYNLHAIHSETRIPADLPAYIHDHPFRAPVAAGTFRTLVHLRQHVSLRDWQRTDNYNGIARPMGYNDQMLALATDAEGFLALGIFRDSVFSDHERSLLALVQPHLLAAWHRVKPVGGIQAAASPAPLMLSPQLRPVGMQHRHRLLLSRYFSPWREPNKLPPELHAWIATSIRRLQNTTPPHPLFAFRADSAHGRLLVRCFPAPSGECYALAMVESPSIPNFFQLRRHGLTPRECEVLHWIAQGKRDAEIAAIIACSPATVGKHVENLLRKLHAENRGAAVRTARAWLERK